MQNNHQEIGSALSHILQNVPDQLKDCSPPLISAMLCTVHEDGHVHVVTTNVEEHHCNPVLYMIATALMSAVSDEDSMRVKPLLEKASVYVESALKIKTGEIVGKNIH